MTQNCRTQYNGIISQQLHNIVMHKICHEQVRPATKATKTHSPADKKKLQFYVLGVFRMYTNACQLIALVQSYCLSIAQSAHQLTNCTNDWLSTLSMVSTSLLKRLRMRPAGLVSKKDLGNRKMCCRRRLCMSTAALTVVYMKRRVLQHRYIIFEVDVKCLWNSWSATGQPDIEHNVTVLKQETSTAILLQPNVRRASINRVR